MRYISTYKLAEVLKEFRVSPERFSELPVAFDMRELKKAKNNDKVYAYLEADKVFKVLNKSLHTQLVVKEIPAGMMYYENVEHVN